MTLIIEHTVKYDWPQFEISLNHQISLTVPILFYNIHGNVTVSVTYNPTFASWPRRRRTWPGVILYETLIVRYIVTYARPQLEISLTHQLEISLTHQINLVIIMCFIINNTSINVNYNRILTSRPSCRRLCPGVSL